MLDLHLIDLILYLVCTLISLLTRFDLLCFALEISLSMQDYNCFVLLFGDISEDNRLSLLFVQCSFLSCLQNSWSFHSTSCIAYRHSLFALLRDTASWATDRGRVTRVVGIGRSRDTATVVPHWLLLVLLQTVVSFKELLLFSFHLL